MADSSPEKVAAAGSVSMEQVTDRLQSQGYSIRKIKFDDGRYKVKATDASGHKQKLYVSLETRATSCPKKTMTRTIDPSCLRPA